MSVEELNKQLLRLILALNANANAYDDDLPETWRAFLEEKKITDSMLETYIAENS